jgi:hypothetical protein
MIDVNDTRPFQFPDTYVTGCMGSPHCGDDFYSPLWGSTNYTGISRSHLWEHAKEFQEGRIIWLDDIPVNNPVAGQALGAIVVQPDFCETVAPEAFLEASACVVGGVWSDVTTSLQTDFFGIFAEVDTTQEIPKSSIATTTFPYLTKWSIGKAFEGLG